MEQEEDEMCRRSAGIGGGDVVLRDDECGEGSEEWMRNGFRHPSTHADHHAKTLPNSCWQRHP